MLKLTKKFRSVFVIVFIWLLFSYPVALGKTPFPADYQVNFFTPWTSYPGMKGPVKNNAQPDIVGQIYPWKYYSILELKQGRIPFWNPYSFAGTPHLANYQSAVLFPLNIIFFLPLSFINAWSFLVILQPLLAGIFIYLLARQLKVSEAGSLISSFSFMYCGFIVTWMGYATLGYAILPLPLALFSIIKYSHNQKMRWMILLASLFPVSFFAGHFQTSVYFAISVFAFIVYNLFLNKKRGLFIAPLIFSFAGLLLTAPQLLPSMEFYSNAIRSEIFKKVEAIPLNYLPTLIAPDFFGNPVTRNDWYGHYAEWSSYSGIIAFALFLFAILFKRNATTTFFVLLALVSFILALDTPIIKLITGFKIPVLSTSSSSRIIVLFSFSVAVLAGFGFDALKKGKISQIIKWIMLLIFIITILLVLGVSKIESDYHMIIAFKNSLLPLLLLLILIIPIILIFKIKKKIFVKTFFVFILILAGFEMLRFASKWQSFDNKKNVYVDLPVLDFLKSKPDYERAIGFNSAEVSVYYGIPVLEGYDPLYIQDYGKFIKYVSSGQTHGLDRSVVLFNTRGVYSNEAIDFLGIKYVVHKYLDNDKPWAFPFERYSETSFTKIFDDGYYQVFENKNAFDKLLLLPIGLVVDDRIDNFLRLIENRQILTGKELGNVKIVDYKQNYIRLKVDAKEQSVLVLTDSYYPGWRVKINGGEEKIHRFSTAFRSVIVPQGESIVEFYYLPSSFLYGSYLFLLGFMVMLSYIIIKRFKLKSR